MSTNHAMYTPYGKSKHNSFPMQRFNGRQKVGHRFLDKGKRPLAPQQTDRHTSFPRVVASHGSRSDEPKSNGGTLFVDFGHFTDVRKRYTPHPHTSTYSRSSSGFIALGETRLLPQGAYRSFHRYAMYQSIPRIDGGYELNLQMEQPALSPIPIQPRVQEG